MNNSIYLAIRILGCVPQDPIAYQQMYCYGQWVGRLLLGAAWDDLENRFDAPI